MAVLGPAAAVVRYRVPFGAETALLGVLVAGLRRSEVLALTVDGVEGSPGARQVAVRHGKSDKYRAVPVDPRGRSCGSATRANR